METLRFYDLLLLSSREETELKAFSVSSEVGSGQFTVQQFYSMSVVQCVNFDPPLDPLPISKSTLNERETLKTDGFFAKLPL